MVALSADVAVGTFVGLEDSLVAYVIAVVVKAGVTAAFVFMIGVVEAGAVVSFFSSNLKWDGKKYEKILENIRVVNDCLPFKRILEL